VENSRRKAGNGADCQEDGWDGFEDEGKRKYLSVENATGWEHHQQIKRRVKAD